ncbi:DEAD/DEAH box helicase [Holzapfeliella sp. He02]|uniref:DEAD-box ATP-dependent RNA helicase CshA n=1 Tax=Holzapfeliella saturejae TaxID=3082953 RepID=A0ABU8SFH2_9LACO
MKFDELNLNSEILQSIKRAGFEEATPIQAQTIPLVLEGKDVIGQAQTGTGKTAAFGLPVLQELKPNTGKVQAIVISPTRELAIQTQEELYRLGRDNKARVQVVYGGSDISRQIRSLKQAPDILVGTPGRLLDHIKRRTVDLSQVQHVVLDEADEMLDMGFVEDIESILSNVPSEHQTLLFSATMPKPIMRIAEKFMQDPEIVQVKSKNLTADKIEQYYIRCKEFEKFDIMTRLFDVQNPELTVLFGRTKRRVDELTKGLQMRGFNAEGIHGDLSQQKRMSVLRQFKAGKLDILVATDVAARGLDVSGVTHVYNYDIPQDPESYVHRIGRTGRAGKDGVSVTFVTGNEMSYLRSIEGLTKKKVLPLAPPSAEEAFKGQLDKSLDHIKSLLGNAKSLSKYEASAEQLLTEYDAKELVSALLKEVTKDPSDVPVKITSERPLPNKNRGGGRGGNRRRNNNGGRRRNNDRRGGDRNRGGNRNRNNDRRKNNDRRGGNGNGNHKKNQNQSKSGNFTIRKK